MPRNHAPFQQTGGAHAPFLSTAGPWEPLIINGAKCEAGSAIPEVRREGDILRFRGAIKVKAGIEIIPTFENAPKLANLPVGISFGSHAVYTPAVHFVKLTPTHTSTSVLEWFQTELEICGGENLKSEDQIDLDGITLFNPSA